MSIFSDHRILAEEARKQRAVIQGAEYHLSQVYAELAIFNRNFALLLKQITRIADALAPRPAGIKLTFEEIPIMTNVKMKKASPGMRADMPPQHWSALSENGNLVFQMVDDQGNDMPDPAADAITTSVTSDNALVTAEATSAPFAYTLHKAASKGGQAVITATITFNDGSFGPFRATLPLILDVPQPGDLKLAFTQK